METARLRAFVETVEKGSVKAAADSLGYTPSAISQLITALEKELGITLFTRSQKGMRPTTEGREMLPLVRAYLTHEEELYTFAAELKGITRGKLTIASYPSIATTWLPEIVRRFKNDYPGIQISLMESIKSDIFRRFEQNEADLAFLAYSEPMPYEWIPLSKTGVIAAVPEDHRLAGAGSFPIKECENEDFIMGSWGKEMEILEILERNDVHPEIKYTTYDTPASLAMVRMGLGISYVNELSAQFWNEHLVKMPLDPPQTITLGVAFPSREHMTGAARKFLDYTLSYFGR
ncbi:MAG: LysR family transcriptional regulator [Mogibacterium sp.]|nr:LysR family transcriptional regulator [Mogibacterium sp.]MBR2390732.1 LysR family transcriptional regulator [Mogibacterium sp.]MBR3331094.1 LysR family transcriptional regulator [Mogibacterium sp.]MBR4090498.1 LysR family transcriptional regulator [Mogibacterium sp.]